MSFISLQIARELTISLANSRFGLFPMKWQEKLDPPKRPDETDLIPNEVLLNLVLLLCVITVLSHVIFFEQSCDLYARLTNICTCSGTNLALKS